MANESTAKMTNGKVSVFTAGDLCFTEGLGYGVSMSIENAERLASDLMNLVFDATENVNDYINFEKVDSEKWEKIKKKLLTSIGFNHFYRTLIDSMTVGWCGHYQNLILTCDNKKISWELKNNKDLCEGFIDFLYANGEEFDLVYISISHEYGEFSR
jgi:hypothetical protein